MNPPFSLQPFIHRILMLVTLATTTLANAQDSVVVFNEVHYHPEGDESSIEYLEIYNQLALDVDISNWRIDGDIDYDFPEGTIIGGHQYLVIAKDPSALATATGYSGALGPFNRNLSNSGDPIYLYNNNRSFASDGSSGSLGQINKNLEGRRIMDTLHYSDTYPWPLGADGAGFSLAKIDQETGTGKATNWTVSSQANGTPGSANSFITLPSLSINEVTSSTNANFEIELHNFGSSSINLGGFVIASSDPLAADYTFPSTSLAAGGFLRINATTLGFTLADNNRLFLFNSGKSNLINTARVDNNDLARFPDGTGEWMRPDLLTLGSPNAVTIEDGIVINEIFYNAQSQIATGTAAITSQQVLDYDSVWRYNLDAGTTGLPAGWATSSHAVDNVSWAQGQGLLGLENSNIGEPINTTVTMSAKIPYYFETDFTYSSSDTVTEMVIDHYIDDGAVFYLNGVEIGRYNMNPGSFTATTTASPGVGNASLQTLIISSPNILQGTNRLSVEIHQINTTSSDVVCGAQITLTKQSNSFTPYAERDEEWIELYNRSAAPIDLTGWEIEGGIEFDFPNTTTIPAGGYLVIAKDVSALAAKHPAITIGGEYSGKLGNSGELITLKDSNGNTADEVNYYDSGKWHSAADGGGSSLELRNPHADNSTAGAWAPSDESARTNWKTYSYEAVAADDGLGLNVFHELQIGLLDAGEVLIDDVSVIENNSTEFIQNSDFESDTIGATADKWRAIGTHGSHGNTVVITDPTNSGNKCLHLVSTGPTENKHNKLETTFANSEEIVPGNTYKITFRAKWLTGSSQLNTKLYFNYLQKTNILDTPQIWGTPGTVNTAAVSNTGPNLSGMIHSPVVPNANQAVSVSIDATDANGINNLTLFYSVDGAAFQTTGMNSTSGRYTGTIPGQSADELIRFYVRATDNNGAISYFPAAAQNGGAFYKTQDGRADTSGLRGNFRIIMSEDDEDFLFVNTNRMSNDRIPATVIENEKTVYYDVRLRLKASAHGRYNGYGYNIRFQPDQLFRDIHNSISIESGTGNQLLAKTLMNRAGGGYWSFYDDVARIITPNGTRGVGLLSLSRHTKRYWDSYFPDEDQSGTLFNLELHYAPNNTVGGDPEGLKIGNPYNHTNGRYLLEDRGTDKEPYRWGYQIRSKRDRDDYSQIIALNQAVGNLSGSALKDALDPLIDVNQWMRTFALMSIDGNDDVYGRIWEHNFRFYVRPTDNKIMIMQWDLDRTFRLSSGASPVPTNNGAGTPLPVAKLFAIPEYRRLFDGHIDDLAQTTFNSSYASSLVSNLSSVAGSTINKTNYINNRANALLSSLPSPVTFLITTNGGNNFSEADSTIDLEGEGSFDVFSIEVNGIVTPVTWTGSDNWQITLPVNPGPTPLTLTAFNYHGVEVGSDTITVNNTSAVDLANANNTIISEIHYHPANPNTTELAAGFLNDSDFEFIELMNTSSNFVDYTNVSFIDGISAIIPAGIVLAPGERLILVANQAAFELRYGTNTAVVAGEFSGSLKNSGERLLLVEANAAVIADVTYYDDNPWPESPDGDGYSLVFVGPDPSDPLDWRPSVYLGGTPGSYISTSFLGGDLLNYVLADSPIPVSTTDSFFLEISVDLSADEASMFVEFSNDLSSWTTATDADLRSRINHGDGTATLLFETPIPVNGTPRHFGRVGVEQ